MQIEPKSMASSDVLRGLAIASRVGEYTTGFYFLWALRKAAKNDSALKMTEYMKNHPVVTWTPTVLELAGQMFDLLAKQRVAREQEETLSKINVEWFTDAASFGKKETS